jgi:hypothetical protein
MSIDYNEVAVYLESLHHRLNQYKTRRWQNTALTLILVLCTLLVFLFSPALRIIPFFTIMLAFVFFIGLVWIGKRVLQTNAEARELEKEVELLRYRLVADDVSLEKLKNDEKSKPESELAELAALGRIQVGDDGELVITPSDSNRRKHQSDP